jgi:predicted RNase H-like nuclease (RuvC/YqgF family)
MIRDPSIIPIAQWTFARRSRGLERCPLSRLLIVTMVVLNSSCTIVPRERMDECQRVSRTLRSENARLKDQVLALQSQNRDYADRAVDDARRVAIQDEAIGRLEQSVQAYQDERSRLETAYKQLVSSLDRTGSRPDVRVGRNTSDPSKSDKAPSASTVR